MWLIKLCISGFLIFHFFYDNIQAHLMTDFINSFNKRNFTEDDEVQIISIPEKVMQHLIQPTDEKYEVVNFDTKDQLIKSFQGLTSMQLAKKLVDAYFFEENGKLFIIPTETPPWFHRDHPYSIAKVNDQVIIEQTNTTDLYGTYTIILEFCYTNGYGWILNDVKYK
jgi:hypothetical protein